MLHLLVLGASLFVGLGLLGYWLLNTKPATLRVTVKWILIVAVAGATIALVLRGGSSLLWLAALLLPLLMRWRSLARLFRNAAKTAAGPSPGQTSTVTSAYLEMTLDLDTGTMAGIVTAGRQAGARLEEMTLEALLDLLQECRGDEQSAQLLESFIDKMHGDTWRYEDTGERARPRAGGATLSRTEALAVLGLGEGAGDRDIRDAHRRLILANHPDRGGSTFIAAQINQAKEVLLGPG